MPGRCRAADRVEGVVEAADGQEALDALAADAPALMVLDLMMPGIDGVEVLRRRQRELLAPNTRVLILTAKLDTQDAVWCWELGADEYVTKPVDADQLVSLLRVWLSR